MTPPTQELLRHASGWSIVWGILLIIFGMLAIGSPFLAAIAVNVFIAWLIMFAGVVHLMDAFHSHRAGSLIWKLLVGVVYLGVGVYLVLHPVLAVVTLTLLLASLFLIEGILDLMLFFKLRSTPGAAWVLIDGLVTLLLSVLIYSRWPSDSGWAIGVLVGASMIVSGVARIMMSFVVRKVARAA